MYSYGDPPTRRRTPIRISCFHAAPARSTLPYFLYFPTSNRFRTVPIWRIRGNCGINRRAPRILTGPLLMWSPIVRVQSQFTSAIRDLAPRSPTTDNYGWIGCSRSRVSWISTQCAHIRCRPGPATLFGSTLIACLTLLSMALQVYLHLMIEVYFEQKSRLGTRVLRTFSYTVSLGDVQYSNVTAAAMLALRSKTLEMSTGMGKSMQSKLSYMSSDGPRNLSSGGSHITRMSA